MMLVVSCQTHSLSSSKQGHSRLESVTRQGWWLLTPLPQMVLHSPSPPQGGESRSSPDTQSVFPDQAQAEAPKVPTLNPRALQGHGLLAVINKLCTMLLSVSAVS